MKKKKKNELEPNAQKKRKRTHARLIVQHIIFRNLHIFVSQTSIFICAPKTIQ